MVLTLLILIPKCPLDWSMSCSFFLFPNSKIGYMCIRVHRRNNHIVEIEGSNNLAKNDVDACSQQQNYQNYLSITSEYMSVSRSSFFSFLPEKPIADEWDSVACDLYSPLYVHIHLPAIFSSLSPCYTSFTWKWVSCEFVQKTVLYRALCVCIVMEGHQRRCLNTFTEHIERPVTSSYYYCSFQTCRHSSHSHTLILCSSLSCDTNTNTNSVPAIDGNVSHRWNLLGRSFTDRRGGLVGQ